MKKCFYLLLLPLLAACSHQVNPVERLADAYPIMPVHEAAGDSTLLYLTDYVPALMADSATAVQCAWQVENQCANSLTETVTIGNSRHIHALLISQDKARLSVPVLPAKEVIPGLVTESCDEGILRVRFVRDIQGTPALHAWIQNRELPAEAWEKQEEDTYVLHFDAKKCIKGRSYLRVYAEDDMTLYNDLLLPLESGRIITSADELTRHDDQAQVLYSLMIDRFENGNTANDRKLNSPEVLDIVDYQGGDFAGITRKIEEGWFDSLGITTIWISPITQNPYSAWGRYPFAPKGDGTNDNRFDNSRAYTKFSGYHGYWPIYVTKLDDRFGTPEEFRQLLAQAHAHNMNVVLDYVANHMHIESPTYTAHPTWHTDSILPDGRRNFELWDEARLTTWFDVHIPTLDLEREDVCQPMTDSALYWLENYELDGFRHDACKHIPLNYWRLLGQKMASRFPDRHIWMIGETYGNPELIGSYVKSGMLPAQFDFNIYHTAIDVLGKEGESMERMGKTILESLAAYGAHHTMGNISGNHDKCRFISLAGGAVRWDENDKLAGWTREIGVLPEGVTDSVREERAYKAAMLLEVINLTIPGVPCIYQGDEYGQAGANDPDNRRMMRFSGLSKREQQFREEMQSLIALRRHSMPLLYGEYLPIENTENRLVFDRTYMGETLRVSIDKETMAYSIENI